MAAFDRICVLTMPYSAAIKTNLYGAWLRLTGSRFTLASWRLIGILSIAAGIVLFCVLAGPGLPLWAMTVFLALLLTDGAVLLAGRFDWGPVALSLAIRLALLGLWIGSEAGEGGPTVRSSFGLGVLVGFAVFEKLSAIVLVPPLAALALPALREGRRRRFGIALAALVALWLTARLPGLVEIERALGAGRASSAWDPSLAEIGRFAAAQPGGAVFVASDWGVATQILAFSHGRAGLVNEPFWRYRGPEQLREIRAQSGARVLYLVRLRNPHRTVPGAMERIERDLAADPRWREVPVEPEAAGLKEVLVRKLVLRP